MPQHWTPLVSSISITLWHSTELYWISPFVMCRNLSCHSLCKFCGLLCFLNLPLNLFLIFLWISDFGCLKDAPSACRSGQAAPGRQAAQQPEWVTEFRAPWEIQPNQTLLCDTFSFCHIKKSQENKPCCRKKKQNLLSLPTDTSAEQT